jgi:CHAD domain-containing protein
MPLPGVAESLKPVTVAGDIHLGLKVHAPGSDKLMVDVVAAKLGELRDPEVLGKFLKNLPPRKKRTAGAATAQVYLPASLHSWLKVIAASHGRPLYQIVEEKLRHLAVVVLASVDDDVSERGSTATHLAHQRRHLHEVRPRADNVNDGIAGSSKCSHDLRVIGALYGHDSRSGGVSCQRRQRPRPMTRSIWS